MGAERAANSRNDKNWEIRRVSAVAPDAESNNCTFVRWGEPLGSRIPRMLNRRADGPKIYALRLRASLFGFNAPAWKTLPVALRVGERALSRKGPLLPGVSSRAFLSAEKPHGPNKDF